ncbi:CDF family Co(II)/Ni(II) efflux transporter DmeF [Lichenihabitans sp. PAMC28606]|uniref:CDF family Co(II)/Ni(II) efflux transporter DmeF n=1 Tax=Lichenihabitans sp. PAMC28606 TaxID=2880932 RepID=UPI001D0B6A88|nr:CDF family Co(II)/Ni(II) efflux transporter DmeF [Lichenihabitans sp. PAMC28606]UDL96266.1 CDF family Co(II)/Ni(II) efflux transporter DmeF [Lichenihabitans sp. PAMC28606]
MTQTVAANDLSHTHVFLGDEHEANKNRTWWVIVLCGVMMVAEIVGGLMFGSIALVADGLHMSTHAGALLLAALAYSFASRHATDRRFTFGTGKLGDLAGFSSAIVLAMIALLIGYEAVSRLFAPVAIHFSEAIPIACFGLAVNIASVWLLSGGGGHHHHGHGHSHGHDDHADAHAEEHCVASGSGSLFLSIFEDGVVPRFRVRFAGMDKPRELTVTTMRPNGELHAYSMVDQGGYLESAEDIPEPHAFSARLRLVDATGPQTHNLAFEEHDHGPEGAHHRDNNMRAAVIHVMADAAVSVLVIVGLFLARAFGWLWMDPLAGIIGACVIASWSYGLIRDTGAILLDMVPDAGTERSIRQTIEAAGDRLSDLHLWRLGPGHLGAILAVETRQPRSPDFYRQQLSRFPSLSHLTVEVRQL